MKPKGPFSAKEAGKGLIAGTLAAIANAVHDACGARIMSFPITPDKALKGLRKNQSKLGPGRVRHACVDDLYNRKRFPPRIARQLIVSRPRQRRPDVNLELDHPRRSHRSLAADIRLPSAENLETP